jgi:hypothetical protein
MASYSYMHKIKQKIIIIFGFVVLLVLFRHFYLYHLDDFKNLMIWMKEGLGWKAIIIGSVFYVLMLSVPFFPGIEIAWVMIFIYGKEAIILLYFLTICGLCLSFGIGRWFEKSWLTTWINIPALKKHFSERSLNIRTRLSSLHPRMAPIIASSQTLTKHHYVLLAIIINVPGNTLVGGGGGISFICGMNHRFSWKGFILTLVLAIAPVPILLMAGVLQFENLI